MKREIWKIINWIGDDPSRAGLRNTPERVVRSWEELYSGYSQNPADIIKTFEEKDFDQIIILKDIEMYSMCEHHMLPFFGKAHVAYIPDGKIIGISKLARLVDIYARRLQIQERIGEQVTAALMKYLNPLGAACIIEATHLCKRMRGCNKQQSIMITSSLKGVFHPNSPNYNSTAKQELMMLIK